MKKNEKAKKLFREGYNCAQAVFCAFSDEIGMDFETALKLSSSFGGGMGRLREVCGAVSSMFMIAGLKKGYITPNNDTIKGEHYAKIQELAKDFESKFGSIVCRDLLGLNTKHDSPIPSKRTEKFYEERPCENFIGYAAEIIEEKLI